LIEGGMNGLQAMLTIALGNLIVLVPMLLNGHVGAKYGIPFPVVVRASYGVRGANIPAMLRAVVACGWFGIQTWIGGFALYQMLAIWFPSLKELPDFLPASLGLKTGPALTFFLFWALNMGVIWLGVESIRKLLGFKAVFLPLAALALLIWAVSAAKGFGPILHQPARFQSSQQFWAFFFPGLTAMVGFWATLSLNIPDFTRYAQSQRAQIMGQAAGLPASMTAVALVGVIVTSATTVVYGAPIWDPIALAGKFESPLSVTFAMAAVVISTLATNIAANIVSPANDFANLAPQWIDFRRGGYITGVIGVLILPWKLVSDPSGYIFTWLVAYSGLLGPICGIMIVDYFVIRKKELRPQELYLKDGAYWFSNGFHLPALIATVLGILPNIPGFLATTHWLPNESVPTWMVSLFHAAWFVGFIVAGLAYWVLSSKRERT
jgi:NCS1 family nucleobase:cation symporter-1